MPRSFRRSSIEVRHGRESSAVRIVADAAIAHPGVGEGRLIPLVILDTSDRPDLEEHIRVHQYIGAGDVNCQWGQVPGHDETVALILTFSRPSEVTAIVEFDLARNHGILIEQVLTAKALYIQAGREGDRLKHDVNLPKVILEVPELGFRKAWDKVHQKFTVEKFRRAGLGKAEAKRAAKQAIEEMRKIATFRLRRAVDAS